MAFLLTNLSSPSIHLQPGKYPNLKPIFNQSPSSSSISYEFEEDNNFSTLSLSSIQSPPLKDAQVKTRHSSQDKHNKHDRDEFYINLGVAVRTLREDLPLLFTKDLNYDIYRSIFLIWVFDISMKERIFGCYLLKFISWVYKKELPSWRIQNLCLFYRDDITLVDPMNTFTGIENYKLIFWALRFHGKILFRDISLEIFRVWQPSENMILIRWNLKGVPRVPWEAKGEFQGTSRYKLDRNGKIYEHKIDNLAFNFPHQLKPAASVLDLVTASPASTPNPTFFFGPVDSSYSSSWIKFYQAVRGTLETEDVFATDSLLTCS